MDVIYDLTKSIRVIWLEAKEKTDAEFFERFRFGWIDCIVVPLKPNQM